MTEKGLPTSASSPDESRYQRQDMHVPTSTSFPISTSMEPVSWSGTPNPSPLVLSQLPINLRALALSHISEAAQNVGGGPHHTIYQIPPVLSPNQPAILPHPPTPSRVEHTRASLIPAIEANHISSTQPCSAQPVQRTQNAIPCRSMHDGLKASQCVSLPRVEDRSDGTLNERASAKKKKKSGRAGAPNYTRDDTDALLDVVEEIEPLGSNQWALVEKKFNDWSKVEERPYRDLDSLKGKFDKLANVKKPTGDPSCPENVRRAKRISRDILAKCNAYSIGDTSESDCNPEQDSFGNQIEKDSLAKDTPNSEPASRSSILGPKRKRKETLGARKNKRREGATGIKESEGDIVAAHIGSMSESINIIAKSFGSQNVYLEQPGLREDIKNIVKEEVREELRVTNDSINELKEMLKIFTKN